MDHFFQLTVLSEKSKTHEKSQRPIGSNKNAAQAAAHAAETKAQEAAANASKKGIKGGAPQV
jgi:hypothetical protein